MATRPTNVFAGGTLDRAAHLRRDPEWLAARRADPDTCLVPQWRGRSLIRWEGDAASAVRLKVGEAPDELRGLLELADPVLLGLADGVPHLGLDLSCHEDAEGHLAALGELLDLRSAGSVLPADDAALLAYARGLFHWHSRHRFCGACGTPTESRQGGHVRTCPACEIDHFPRTDPAVIMLVTRGDTALLGHQDAWPEGMYSTLAGFVEPGECLEEAVAREVMEEAGVAVEDVQYHSSQPWPFPGSLMLGFTARATTDEIHLRDGELADARWFHRDELRAAEGPPGLRLPSEISIARRLVEDWMK